MFYVTTHMFCCLCRYLTTYVYIIFSSKNKIPAAKTTSHFIQVV